jgi:hypothetical protein
MQAVRAISHAARSAPALVSTSIPSALSAPIAHRAVVRDLHAEGERALAQR